MEELLKETRQDVKEIKKMLHEHIVEEAELKAQVNLHSSWFKVLGAFVAGIITFLFKDRLL